MLWRRLSALVASVFLLAGVCWGITAPAQATEFTSLDIQVTVDESGAAHITQVWNTVDDRGTEKYIPIGELAPTMTVRNLRVSEGGVAFEPLEHWDVSASREEKAQKSGIHYTDDGLELCWGIGSYGPHSFTVQYVVDNFVASLTDDTQVVNWQFVNPGLSEPPQQVSVTIDSPQFTDGVLADALGFGFRGTVSVTGNQIHVVSDEPIDSDEYVVVLAKMSGQPFATQTHLDQTYDEVLATSMEGAQEQQDNTLLVFLITAALIVGTGLLIATPLVVIGLRERKKKSMKREALAVLPLQLSDTYTHQPPHFDLPLMLGLADAGEESFAGKIRANLPEGTFMTWLLRGYIRSVTVDFGTGIAMQMLAPSGAEIQGDAWERSFYDMCREAAGANGILESYELKKFMEKKVHARMWLDNLSTLNKRADAQAMAQGLAEKRSGKVLGIFPVTTDCLTPAGATHMAEYRGFMNYLSDFTLINEREITELGLWRDYMVYAAYFGIADEVAARLRSLLPNFSVLPEIDQAVQMTTSLGIAHYQGFSAYQSNASGGSSSSSFSGGGGGSFGGSVGGGTR